MTTNGARIGPPDGRLKEVIGAAPHRFISTDETLTDLEAVTLELENETIEAVDEKAFTEHRDAALRDLLNEWLQTRE